MDGKVYIMIDTGSTGNFMSPAFAKVTGMKVFPLEQLLTLQLGCIGSWLVLESPVLRTGKRLEPNWTTTNQDQDQQRPNSQSLLVSVSVFLSSSKTDKRPVKTSLFDGPFMHSRNEF